MNILKDSNGKTSASKIAYLTSLAVCLIKIIISGLAIGDVTMEVADYSGMAMFLTPLAALYYGEGHTKAKIK